LVTQPLASNTETINPFGTNQFNGQLVISPPNDVWFDDGGRPTVLINIENLNENISENWSVEVVDTGLDTMTGGRIKRIEKYINNEKFFLLYGDDLKSVNITELLNFHIKNKKFVTVTAAQPPGRFGILKLEENNVVEMREKPPGDENWINGGYYILEPEIFNYISKDSDIWESGPLNKLIEEKQVSAFKYTGIYQPLDTLNDKIDLEKMWDDGKPYWKVWE